MQPADTNETPARRRKSLPLYMRVLIGVAAGIALGVIFKTGPIIGGLRNEDLGQLGLLVIRLLKALAVPLILFAILDAFLRVNISGRRGAWLILICLCNVSVAFAIGLTLLNTLRPGEQWRGRLNEIAGVVESETASFSAARPEPPKATLDPLKNIAGYVPESLVDPFTKNNVITVVLLALLAGAALRHVKRQQQATGATSFHVVERFIEAVYHTLIQMLHWVVQAVPFAVFGVVAQVVGRSGITVFHALGGFLGITLLGLAIHSLVYYPLVARLVGRKSPRVYLGRGADAILPACRATAASRRCR
jgi:DAACS family dicarboxylate/amino acid:cation (Na+ or H+) symporter